jgi:hypothetical protein
MGERYTHKDCERAVKRLAELLGKPTDAYGKDDDGKLQANIGAWYLDYNSIYGGAIINEIVNKGGGITHPMGEGRMKPYDFCRMIKAFEDMLYHGHIKVGNSKEAN